MANESTVTIDDTLREAEALMEKGLHGRALDMLSDLKQSPQATARLWFDVGGCLAAVSRHSDALAHFRKSAELATAAGDRDAVGKALEHAGLAQYNRRHHRDAQELYRQALAVRKAAGDKAGEARCHRSLGNIHLDLGERSQARTEFETARKLSQEVADVETLAICVMSLASLDYEKDGRQAAIETYRKAIAEDPCEHHIVLNNLGFLLTLDQQLEDAEHFLQRAWK
ncbi:MAG: tetratricopeptide repeat protein, partial [Candidatus Xenobia bacterium]